jgi:hypothetical protein
MWIALAVSVGIPLYAWRRRRHVMSGLHTFLVERHFMERESSPIAVLAAPNPPDGFHFSAAYGGTVDGVPLMLLLLRRSEAVLVQGMSMQNQTTYVGAYLPPGAASADAVADWQRKAQKQREHVVHVSQPAEGGLLIVWKGAPSRGNVEAHVAALLGTLRYRRAHEPLCGTRAAHDP